MAFFSTNSRDYASAIQSLVKPTYQSKYENLIEQQMNKILNREDFKYDFNADPLYQNYKDQYTKLGKEAAINATAAASALTGGYGNSYAGTAASQANQQYLTQLNERIPELYNAAMQKYNMETENMYNQFGALQTEEGRQYGMYRDKVSDYYSDLSDLRNGHATAQAQENADREFEYRKSRDAVSDSQWSQNYAYQQARDAISDSHWQQEFDTKNSQWQKEYELALKKARSGGGSGGGSSANGGNIVVKDAPKKGLNGGWNLSPTMQSRISAIEKALLSSNNPEKLIEDLARTGEFYDEDIEWMYNRIRK